MAKAQDTDSDLGPDKIRIFATQHSSPFYSYHDDLLLFFTPDLLLIPTEKLK
jgi:hypothetical protein